MSREEKQSNDLFFSVVGGKLRTKVSADHPEAELREYTLKDGTKGAKYERVVNALFGRIEKIDFYEGDYGKNIQVTLDANEDGRKPIISVGVATNYGEDFMRKIPNINFSKEVRIRPWVWTPEGSEKEYRGMDVAQQDDEGMFKVVVKDFFHSEDKTPINGYPKPEGDTEKYDSEDWKVYFIQARKFLIKYIEEKIIPQFGQEKVNAPEAPTEHAEEPAF